MRLPGRHFPRAAAVVAVAGGLGLLTLGGLAGGILGGYKLQASDRLFPTGSMDDRLVVVGIDARSLDVAQERWPWPRELHAQLVANLAEAGVRIIAYDVIFSPGAAGDADLAAALAEVEVVLGALADLERAPGRRLPVAVDVVLPVHELTSAAEATGHTNVTPDPGDGVVRSLPLVAETATGEHVLSLTLATYMHVEGIDGPLTLRPSGIQVGDRLIPTGPLSIMDISYPEHTSGSVVSAADVLRGEVVDELAGKIVLIGVTDPALGDHRLTPVDKSVGTPGVIVHANALNTMLTRAYLTHSSRAETIAWVVLLAGLVAFLVLNVRMMVVVPTTVLLGAAYLVAATLRFDADHVMDLIYPPLAIVLSFIAALALRYGFERHERRRVSALFSQYVPDTVAAQLLDRDAIEEAMRVKKTEVAVLFCDLRNFTATASQLEPADVGRLLESYYEATTELVFSNGGTLMQYVGDEVFALFGAPLPDPKADEAAVACALDFQTARERINAKLAEQRLPPISYGIGLHIGEVVTAHIGTQRRRQFAAIGDTVNCGARLCSISGPGEIVVSGDLYERLDNPPPATAVAPVGLKGVSKDLRPHRIESGA